ncbi:maleylpyruvate isomerase family mycothiol-dependent enzyme [Streptomyces sp. ME02-8801-2C]|uniref:maleylpyruvate isomerase family mycothiol-dependent enzyme n=1 Tax=Streptomyces sp. ME02-8801-2C TaxID=3028680 RepID=UPI0029B45702|nr:maleylpyruvate isomerase family mycothiol-dependent enzyme [Streptomyces sp. ME02-8801-2C]MDX3452415.1 maleylpyruvate isomerase family mycothiol-dependent enzyme [Streptomyces sp. ME02-8801-2C]
METARFVETLAAEGQLLADAAERAGTDAKVPTCPDWQVSDLVRHTGMVHRWAAAHVAERRMTPNRPSGPPDLDGDALLTWFREGHRILVDTLASAPPDLECWTFLPAPSALAFWTRRQAHETSVHRVDAESALGTARTPLDPDFATDGIDEILLGFHARTRSQVRTDEPRVLRVRATDRDDALWTVRLTSESPAAERVTRQADRSAQDADCEVSGTAAELYLALWNRQPFPGVSGDPALAALWQEKSAI